MKKKTIGIIAISVLCAFAILAGAMFTHQYVEAINRVLEHYLSEPIILEKEDA